MTLKHSFHARVYYEDTDAGGVVYYANYLKFAERARTELLREAGIAQSDQDILFVVRNATLDLKQPARLDDMLTIHTTLLTLKGASFMLLQQIMRDETILATLEVTIACITPSFTPARIPPTYTRGLCMKYLLSLCCIIVTLAPVLGYAAPKIVINRPSNTECNKVLHTIVDHAAQHNYCREDSECVPLLLGCHYPVIYWLTALRVSCPLSAKSSYDSICGGCNDDCQPPRSAARCVRGKCRY